MIMKPASNPTTADQPMGARLADQSSGGAWSRPGWWRIVRIWTERQRQRHALAALDDRLLADIGVTRYEVGREVAKPFWR